MADEDRQTRGVQAISRALGVLDAFTQDRPELSLTDIAGRIGVSLPTAHRITAALGAQGYLTRHPKTLLYSLGPAILRLSNLLSDQHSSVDGEALSRVREETGESVSLHTRIGDRRICIMEYPSRQTIRVVSGVGRSYSLTSGAASKAILSLLFDGEVERLIDLGPDPEEQPLPRQRILVEVRRARRDGFTVSRGETVRGAFAIAVPAPPLTPQGAPCAINLTGPRERMTKDVMSRGLDAMRDAVQATWHRGPSGLTISQ